MAYPGKIRVSFAPIMEDVVIESVDPDGNKHRNYITISDAKQLRSQLDVVISEANIHDEQRRINGDV